MIFLLLLIAVLSYVLIRCVLYFRVAFKHIKHIRDSAEEYFEAEKAIKHTHAHLAGVILIFCCGCLMMAGLFFIGVDIFYFKRPVPPELMNYLFGVSAVYLLSNAWYIKHVQEEEEGKFDH
jgi:hypothetical protein